MAASQLGCLLAAKGKNAEAEALLKGAEPGLPEGGRKRAIAAWLDQHSGDVEAALAGYRAAVDMEPTLAFAWEGIAAILYRRADLVHALEAYEQLARLRPREPEALVRIGSLNLKLGKAGAAKAAWEAALVLQPNNALVRKNLAVLGGGA
jgi:superkiller protein 3